MKSIILRTPEVNTLQETGIVTVVRAVNQKKLQKDRLKLNMQIFEIYQAPEKVCPFGQPGEVFYVREAWALSHDPYSGYYLHYKAIDNGQRGIKIYAKDMTDEFEKYNSCSWLKWRSSSTMPQWASRYNVECTVVKVEQIEGIWSWIVSYKKVGR